MLANSITNQQLRQDVRQALESRRYRPAEGGRADFGVAVYAAAPTDATRKRVAMRVRVPDLLPVLGALQGKGLTVDHIYDY